MVIIVVMKTQRILYLIYIALVVVTLGYGIWSVGDSENRTREMVPFYDKIGRAHV